MALRFYDRASKKRNCYASPTFNSNAASASANEQAKEKPGRAARSRVDHAFADTPARLNSASARWPKSGDMW